MPQAICIADGGERSDAEISQDRQTHTLVTQDHHRMDRRWLSFSEGGIQVSSITEQRIETVEIESIDRQHTQLRVKMDPQAVEDYAEQYRNKKDCQMPPIVIFEDTEADVWHLGDGYHRCEAAIAAGRKSIDAEIRQGTLDDAIMFAAKCNSHNAVRWSRKDMVKAVRTLKDRFPKMNQRAISKQCGCSQGFVSNVLSGKCDEGATVDKSKPKSTSRQEEPSIEETFADLAEQLKASVIDMDASGGIDPDNPIVIRGLLDLVSIVKFLTDRFPHAFDHADQPSDEVVEAEVVPRIESPSDEYADAEDATDGNEPAPEVKRSRGRPRSRFVVTGSRKCWFVEDTEGEIDEAGPFDTQAEAKACVREMQETNLVA